MGVFSPTMPSFMPLFSSPGPVALNSDPCLFERSSLASGAGQSFSSHRWAFLSPLQVALVLAIPRKMRFTWFGVFKCLLSFPL